MVGEDGTGTHVMGQTGVKERAPVGMRQPTGGGLKGGGDASLLGVSVGVRHVVCAARSAPVTAGVAGGCDGVTGGGNGVTV